MTFLIIEQGAAIQSQSNLIKILLPDSRELWSLKGKAIADKQKSKALTQAQVPQAKTPSGNTQVQAPSAQASQQPHAQSRAGKVVRPQSQFPPIPVSDLDPRRSVRTI
jgi:hypothetical protein